MIDDHYLHILTRAKQQKRILSDYLDGIRLFVSIVQRCLHYANEKRVDKNVDCNCKMKYMAKCHWSLGTLYKYKFWNKLLGFLNWNGCFIDGDCWVIHWSLIILIYIRKINSFILPELSKKHENFKTFLKQKQLSKSQLEIP